MTEFTTAEKAYAELAELEKLDAAWGQSSIDAKASRIRSQFAAGGVTVDQELGSRIKAAVVRANGIAAEKSLAELEKLDAAWGQSPIDAKASRIRSQFAAGGVTVDQELGSRIKAAVVRANGIAAEKSLAELEKLDAAWGESSIDAKASQIRSQFAAGGVTVNQELGSRIKAAVVRANGIAAEKSLAELEKLDEAWGQSSIDAKASRIRSQFAAGGTKLTAQGELPDGLQARLNAATARALKTAEYSKA